MNAQLLDPLPQRTQCGRLNVTVAESHDRKETRRFEWYCEMWLPPTHGGHCRPPDDVSTELHLFSRPPKKAPTS